MRSLVAVAVATFYMIPVFSIAGEFSIKGIEIGMNIEDYKNEGTCRPKANGDVVCVDQNSTMTVGGESIKTSIVTFEKGATSSLIYLEFDSDKFDAVKSAISGKYRSLKCSKSVVENKFGAKFINEKCFLKGKKESISVERFSGNINDGSVTIVADFVVHRSVAESSAKAGDI